jgi:hypothetical protein
MNQANQRFAHFRRAAEDAPEGTYEASKAVREAIGDAVDGLISRFRELGFVVDNSDGAHDAEASLFAWLHASNPATELDAAIGFGSAMNGPAADRVRAQAARDRDFLASLRSPA